MIRRPLIKRLAACVISAALIISSYPCAVFADEAPSNEASGEWAVPVASDTGMQCYVRISAHDADKKQYVTYERGPQFYGSEYDLFYLRDEISTTLVIPGSDVINAASNEGAEEVSAEYYDTVWDDSQTFKMIDRGDGTFSLMSMANRMYLEKYSYISKSDFADVYEEVYHTRATETECNSDTKLKLEVQEVNGNITTAYIVWADDSFSGTTTDREKKYMRYEGEIYGDEVGLIESDVRAKAKLFDIEFKYVDSGERSLASQKWFNYGQSGQGYWHVQSEADVGRVTALKQMGFTPMRLNGSDVIRSGEMSCTIGISQSFSMYDVIIAFADYTDMFPSQDLDSNNECQEFSQKVSKLISLSSSIIGSTDGTVKGYITLDKLFDKARTGKVTITILGHGMGGGIAQCLATYLTRARQIEESVIHGYTFNTAIAMNRYIDVINRAGEPDGGLTDDLGDTETGEDFLNGGSSLHRSDSFVNWYNLCVETDSMPNGRSSMALPYKTGRFDWLGHTIWIKDPDPGNFRQKSNSSSTDGVTFTRKHAMNEVLLEQLQTFAAGDTEDLSIKRYSAARTFMTVAPDLQSNNGPYADSGVAGEYPLIGTVVNVSGEVVNKYGNKWYQLTDGSWMYGRNIGRFRTYGLGTSYVVTSNKAPVRSGFYKTCGVNANVSKAAELYVDASVENQYDHIWYRVSGTSDGRSVEGWIFSDHVIPKSASAIDEWSLKNGNTRIKIRCPVDVEIFDGDGRSVGRINSTEAYDADSYDSVVPELLDDVKIIYLFEGNDCRLALTGTDTGTMDISIEDYYDAEAGEYTDNKEFYDVLLEKDKTFRCTIDTGAIHQTRLDVTDENGTVLETVTPVPETDKLTAISGADRYETGVLIAKQAFPEGADEAVIVTGQKFPDALAAGALAGAKNCPILLSRLSALPEAAKTLLKDTWNKRVTTVHLVGGGFSGQFFTDLTECGVRVVDDESYNGRDRFETAEKVCSVGLEAGFFNTDVCILTTGLKPADALSISPWSYRSHWPILLVGRNGISDSTLKLVNRFKTVYILGHAEDPGKLKTGIKVIELAGANRYETSARIAEAFTGNEARKLDQAAFAPGSDNNFPDALVGGILQGAYESPILLVSDSDYGKAAYDYAAGYLTNDNVRTLYMLGAAAQGTLAGRIREALDISPAL